nr:WS/DGAT domain-containing protein [Nocardioides convexus]
MPPLTPGHPLAISVTSYDGGVFYGITADRDWIPDAELLGVCVREALDEAPGPLLGDAGAGSARAPRNQAQAQARRQDQPDRTRLTGAEPSLRRRAAAVRRAGRGSGPGRR